MLERTHWRKTARVCEKCHTLTSRKKFLPDSNICVKCDWNEEKERIYKQCPYCRVFFKREEITGTLCDDCKALSRKKYSLFKRHPKLDKEPTNVCTVCNIAKRARSYSRGSDLNNLVCKTCATNKKIEEEGKFRCTKCGSVFSKQNLSPWKKILCMRCFKKEKEWNKNKLKELRKDPYWQDYFKEYAKYAYWHKERPILNALLFLQWTRGFAKKRKIDRGKGWYMVNRAMFGDFRKRPRQWYAMCSDVINKLYTGKFSELDHIKYNSPSLFK